MAGNKQLFAEFDRASESFGFFLIEKEYQDNRFVSKQYASGLEWSPLPEAAACKPAFSLGRDEAQAVFNDLWKAGMRPPGHYLTEYTAQGKHLEDMRALAFGKLGVEKP